MKAVRAWAVISLEGTMRCRAVQDTFDDWQCKIYMTKRVARKYAWPNEIIVPVLITEAEGKRERVK